MGNSHFQVQRKKNNCASKSGPHATAIPRHVSVHPRGDFAECSMMWAKREKWIHVVLKVWIVISGTNKQNWVLAWLAKQKHQNTEEKIYLMPRRGEIRQMAMWVAYQNKPLMWFIQQLVLINHFDWTRSIPRVLVQKGGGGIGIHLHNRTHRVTISGVVHCVRTGVWSSTSVSSPSWGVQTETK